jgi:hypothetical protein
VNLTRVPSGVPPCCCTVPIPATLACPTGAPATPCAPPRGCRDVAASSSVAHSASGRGQMQADGDTDTLRTCRAGTRP